MHSAKPEPERLTDPASAAADLPWNGRQEPARAALRVLIPRVVIVDPERSDGERLRKRAGPRCPGVALELMTDIDAVVWNLDSHPIDVALIRLGVESCEGLLCGTVLARRAPWVPVLFWIAGENTGVQAQVAAALGIKRLIHEDELLLWLPGAVGPLARYARARREVEEAEAGLPPMPAGAAPAGAVPEPLRQAEQTFRELYLRALLARSTTRQEAATRAGLPYTTLVSMLKKLRIPG